MRLTTKGRYTLSALFNLSKCSRESPTALSTIARDQDLSVNYLEQLFLRLRKSGIVTSARGPHGGYRLSRSPKEITIGEILRASGEDVFPVHCRKEFANDSGKCPHAGTCQTHFLWEALGDTIDRFLDATTLDDVNRLAAESAGSADAPVPALAAAGGARVASAG
jgi:Rrf2 family iron-sulfur cluster assembly transcriptional regulator